MLTVDQRGRYARQLLLTDVGDPGQSRLLATPVRALGSGLALETAAAYLAAGGTPVEWLGPEAGAGFLVPHVPSALADLNPDAAAERCAPAASPNGPARLESTAGLVLIAQGRVAWFPPAACARCVALFAGSQGGGVEEGALAALAMQRLVLGLETTAGCVTLDGRAELPRCPEH